MGVVRLFYSSRSASALDVAALRDILLSHQVAFDEVDVTLEPQEWEDACEVFHPPQGTQFPVLTIGDSYILEANRAIRLHEQRGLIELLIGKHAEPKRKEDRKPLMASYTLDEYDIDQPTYLHARAVSPHPAAPVLAARRLQYDYDDTPRRTLYEDDPYHPVSAYHDEPFTPLRGPPLYDRYPDYVDRPVGRSPVLHAEYVESRPPPRVEHKPYKETAVQPDLADDHTTVRLFIGGPRHLFDERARLALRKALAELLGVSLMRVRADAVEKLRSPRSPSMNPIVWCACSGQSRRGERRTKIIRLRCRLLA